MVNKRNGVVSLAVLCALAGAAHGQTPQRIAEPNWEKAILKGITVDVGYPGTLALGGFVVAGSYRDRIDFKPGRFGTPTDVRGLLVGADAGFGAWSARVGWANLRSIPGHWGPSGLEGFSIEARYVRPWVVRWGLRPGGDYVGVGATYSLKAVKGLAVSSTLLRSVDGAPRQWVPSISLHYRGMF
jgi:hypothetical protein